MNKIQWKNIFYMLEYCVDELEYCDISNIDFENICSTNDLLARLLCNAFETLYKNGYLKEYKAEQIITDKPRGKIDIPKSVRVGSIVNSKLVCRVNNMNIDNKLNKIIKSTFSILINLRSEKDNKVSKEYLTQLNNYMQMMNGVGYIEISSKMLDEIKDMPEWYRPIIAICKLILNDWIAIDKEGKHRVLSLSNRDRLCYIWEKFIRTLIKKEIAPTYKVTKPTYKFSEQKSINPDIQIYKKSSKGLIIIDCKWYERQEPTSANMYQMVAYTSNISSYHPNKELVGLVIYATDNKTEQTDLMTKEKNNINAVIQEWRLNINQDLEQVKIELRNIILNALSIEQIGGEY